MLGSLFKSMTGLIGFTQSLDNLSNNVANLNTPGYKGNDVLFRELGSESFSSNGDRGNGLSNDVGSGVRVAGTVTRFTQGDIKQTGVDTDLAINGTAFFVLDGNGTEYFTRSGQFRFDQDGFLADPATGFRVLMLNENGRTGYLNIRSFEFSRPQASTEVTFRGSLDASEEEDTLYPAADEDPFSVSVFDDTGQEHTLNVAFTKQADRAWMVSVTNDQGSLVAPEHVIDFTSLGSIVTSTAQLRFDYQPFQLLEQDALHAAFNPGSPMTFENGHSEEVTTSFTVSDAHFILRNPSNLEFTQQGTFSINDDGFLVDAATSMRVAARNEDGEITDFNISESLETPAEATEEISISGNLSTDIAVGGSYPPTGEAALQYTYLNEDGVEQSLQIRFTRAASNRWTVDARNSDGTSIDVAGALFFDANGQIISSTSAILIQLSEQDGTDIELTFLDEDGNSTLSALGTTSSVSQTGNDGNIAGQLSSVTFDQNGVATMTYTNGEEETGPQLAIVEFNGGRIDGLNLDFSELTSVASDQSEVSAGEIDGRALGQIASYQFNEFGELQITYSNGDETTSSPIALASILDQSQLYAVGNTLFRLQEGGERSLGNAQHDGMAKIAPRSLELSNVELSREFADIIIVQRGYQASSQVLNVTNQMIEELYNSVKGR